VPDAVPVAGPPSGGTLPSPIPALKSVFAGQFAIGAAVGTAQLSGAQADLLTRQFNSVTPTSAMKWASTEPSSGSFDFSDADAIVNFAVANDVKVRGHTLVW
jgi:endo-1,4-beta-xylanase